MVLVHVFLLLLAVLLIASAEPYRQREGHHARKHHEAAAHHHHHHHKHLSDTAEGQTTPTAALGPVTLKQADDEISKAWAHQAHLEQLSRTIQSEKELLAQEEHLKAFAQDDSAKEDQGDQLEDTRRLLKHAEMSLQSSRAQAIQESKEALESAKDIKAKAGQEFLASQMAVKQAQAQKAAAAERYKQANQLAAMAQGEVEFYLNNDRGQGKWEFVGGPLAAEKVEMHFSAVPVATAASPEAKPSSQPLAIRKRETGAKVVPAAKEAAKAKHEVPAHKKAEASVSAAKKTGEKTVKKENAAKPWPATEREEKQTKQPVSPAHHQEGMPPKAPSAYKGFDVSRLFDRIR